MQKFLINKLRMTDKVLDINVETLKDPLVSVKYFKMTDKVANTRN